MPVINSDNGQIIRCPDTHAIQSAVTKDSAYIGLSKNGSTGPLDIAFVLDANGVPHLQIIADGFVYVIDAGKLVEKLGLRPVASVVKT